MQVFARRDDETTIFDISGDIDSAISPELRKSMLHEIRESGASCVIVNLSQVRYIDSSVVAILVEALKASRDLGYRFILFGLSRSARGVLRLSRVDKIFEIYDNKEQALASRQGNSPPNKRQHPISSVGDGGDDRKPQ